MGHLRRQSPGDSIRTVSDVMTRIPYTIDAAQPLAEAHARMRSKQIRHLPVTRDGSLVGIVSMRDLHLIETLKDVDPAQVQVEEAMSEQPAVVEPDATLDQVAQMMVAKKIGSVLVVERGELLGIFTTIDALGALLRIAQAY